MENDGKTHGIPWNIHGKGWTSGILGGFFRSVKRQTGPAGLPEWLADLAPKEPRARDLRGGIQGDSIG